MAVPSIPTSFMPHQGTASAARQTSDAAVKVFSYGAYVVLGVACVLAFAVFSYEHLLNSTKASKDAALQQAIKDIPVGTVKDFVRLHDRLISASNLLNAHIAFSGFFPVLEAVMPSTTRFTSIHISLDDQGAPLFSAQGIAKNYNALAVASAQFAKDARIKHALFTGIAANKDNSVSFNLSGGLDPEVIAFTP